MTPAARVAAAIEVLDQYLNGMPLEQALTSWSRNHRFAGSKDRAAIRDHVFDATRKLRSSMALGNGKTGRAVMIGLLRQNQQDLSEIFSGNGYGPEKLTEEEREATGELSHNERLDCPDWLQDPIEQSIGDAAEVVLETLRHRAPLFLRVNVARASKEQAIAQLAKDHIIARNASLGETALEVVENPRKIASSSAYLSGLVELQDAASQALVDMLEIKPGMRVLDFCAGGGGKSLAMAALGAEVVAHDISPSRMKDIPQRSARAGVDIRCVTPDELPKLGQFDLVFADAPCSGSGTWRRSPQGKWLYNPQQHAELLQVQQSIINALPNYIAPISRLAYGTCSFLSEENQSQIDQFISSHPDYACINQQQFLPNDHGDGFFLSILSKN